MNNNKGTLDEPKTIEDHVKFSLKQEAINLIVALETDQQNEDLTKVTKRIAALGASLK